MTAQPIVYLRLADAGTDNACWVVCIKGDPGAVAFAPYKGEPPTELCDLEGSPPEMSEHNAFSPATEYPRTYGELRNNIAGASVLPRGITVFDGCKVDFSKPKDGK